MAEEDGAAGFELDEQGDEGEEPGQEKNNDGKAENDVEAALFEAAFDVLLQGLGAEADDGDGIQEFDVVVGLEGAAEVGDELDADAVLVGDFDEAAELQVFAGEDGGIDFADVVFGGELDALLDFGNDLSVGVDGEGVGVLVEEALEVVHVVIDDEVFGELQAGAVVSHDGDLGVEARPLGEGLGEVGEEEAADDEQDNHDAVTNGEELEREMRFAVVDEEDQEEQGVYYRRFPRLAENHFQARHGCLVIEAQEPRKR